jgi:hypothetical protein
VADLRMTPTRAALLRAVADPDIEVFAVFGGLRGSWSTADVWIREPGRALRKVTALAGWLEAVGMVRRGPVRNRYHAPRHYTLTDNGRAALAALDAKE